MNRFRLATCVSLAASLITPAAFAEEVEVKGERAPVEAKEEDQVRVVLGLQTGLAGGLSGYEGGLELGLSLDVRTAPVTVGVVVSSIVGDFFEGSATQYALHGGHTFMLTPDLAFDVLAEVGLREETANDGLFSGDPGASTTQGFVGARLNLDYALTDPRAASAMRLGLSAFARMNVAGEVVQTYSYEDCFFTCGNESTSHSVGGTNDVGIVLTLSADFGG